ncbi:hypothetical protein F5Y15DRAFT_419955 [Xylariaceae sp. FL0016]|nr:hypothetical protein F5Y15DRAFT_419955 [Xylariaceae sp. FL0016]
MANDSLKSLIANVPDWLKRLEELSTQVERRQQDLARLAESQKLRSSARSVRSVRNQGSTESLKPKDDGAAFPTPADPRATTPPPPTRRDTQQPNGQQPPSTPASEPKSGSSLLRQDNEVKATAQKRARAAVQKKQKTESMISGEQSTPKYRSRRMIEVYYDSYVQSFFGELVKFVSSQRHVMRKAKMAAKVAHIKRLAELEMPDEDDDDDGGELKPGDGLIAADPEASGSNPNTDGSDELKLRYFSARQGGSAMQSPAMQMSMMKMRGRQGVLNGGLGGFNEKGDIWDQLDKGLEYVQGMCERAAHQSLRDGNCEEEIEKIKGRLNGVKDMAEKEEQRLNCEKQNGTNEPGPNSDSDPVRRRTFRPMTMRRETGASSTSNRAKAEVLEVDDDEGVQDMDDFQPVYSSTRLMNGPA